MKPIESVFVTTERNSFLYVDDPLVALDGGVLAVDYQSDNGQTVSVLFSPSEWKKAVVKYKDEA